MVKILCNTKTGENVRLDWYVIENVHYCTTYGYGDISFCLEKIRQTARDQFWKAAEICPQDSDRDELTGVEVGDFFKYVTNFNMQLNHYVG